MALRHPRFDTRPAPPPWRAAVPRNPEADWGHAAEAVRAAEGPAAPDAHAPAPDGRDRGRRQLTPHRRLAKHGKLTAQRRDAPPFGDRPRIAHVARRLGSLHVEQGRLHSLQPCRRYSSTLASKYSLLPHKVEAGGSDPLASFKFRY